MEQGQLLVDIAVSIILFFSMKFIDNQLRLRNPIADPCELKIAIAVKNIKTEYDQKISQLKEERRREVDELETKIELLLELLLKARKESFSVSLAPNEQHRVLLACGDNDEFCATDSRVLRRAHVDFTTVRKADNISIAREIRRGLQDKRPYTAVHISAHGSETHILMNGREVSPEELEIALLSVNLVILSACKSHSLADKITSPGRTVITILENITNEDAEEFTFLVWKGICSGQTPESAFNLARSDFPQIADKVGIRYDKLRQF